MHNLKTMNSTVKALKLETDTHVEFVLKLYKNFSFSYLKEEFFTQCFREQLKTNTKITDIKFILSDCPRPSCHLGTTPPHWSKAANYVRQNPFSYEGIWVYQWKELVRELKQKEGEPFFSAGCVDHTKWLHQTVMDSLTDHPISPYLVVVCISPDSSLYSGSSTHILVFWLGALQLTFWLLCQLSWPSVITSLTPSILPRVVQAPNSVLNHLYCECIKWFLFSWQSPGWQSCIWIVW